MKLPILKAFQYLYDNQLTIDVLWTAPDGEHITTKPIAEKEDTVIPVEKVEARCFACGEVKDKPEHITCLKADCVRMYLFGK